MHLPDDIPDLSRGRVVGDLGMPGSGKTEDLAQIVAFYDGPVLAIDTVKALTERLDGADVWLIHIHKGLDINSLWVATAKRLNAREKVVWDLRDWTPPEIQLFIEALMPRIETLRDTLVVVDEVQRIAPDFSADLGRGSPRFKDWVAKRRNDGVPLVWTSQRPAFVSMSVRGLTDHFLIHRLFWPNDIDVVANLLKRQPGIDAAALTSAVGGSLGPGEVLRIDMPFMA